MEFSGFLLVAAGILVVFIVLGRMGKKWFAVDKQVLESAAAKKINRWSSWALVSVFVASFFYRIQFQDEYGYLIGIAVAVIVIAVVQSYFERKLLEGSKKYRMTLVTYGLALAVIFSVMIFL